MRILPALLLFAGGLAAGAADESAAPRAPAESGCPTSSCPSTFDYIVLASLADSPQLHAMAGFRTSASQRSETPVADPPPANLPVKAKANAPLKAEDWHR